MMKAGVPLVQSFEIVGNGHENIAMQEMVLGLKAEVEGGNSLTEALKKLNRTSDREKETAKIKTAICRLRQDLKSAMGLEDSPIITSSGSYRFTFKVMTHEMLKDSNVSKGADAMDYADSENFDDNKYRSTSFIVKS